MKGIRLERMKKELFKLISSAYAFSVYDDRLHSIRITGIKLSPDLLLLKITYDYFNRKISKKQMQELIEKSSGFIKKQIAGAKIMRRIPQISFQYDSTEEKASQLDKVFAVIEAEKRRNSYDDDEYDDDVDIIDGDDFDDDEYDDFDNDEYDDFDDDFEDEIIDEEDEDDF